MNVNLHIHLLVNLHSPLHVPDQLELKNIICIEYHTVKIRVLVCMLYNSILGSYSDSVVTDIKLQLFFFSITLYASYGKGYTHRIS